MSTVAQSSREPEVIGLTACCRRIGISRATAARWLENGVFPIPHVPRVGGTSHYRFIVKDIDFYLANASTRDARVRRRRR